MTIASPDDRFARNVPGMTECLQTAVIGIAGCGGLGSNAAAALARAGIGTLILADSDIVELSNLNRQYFFSDDVGKPKTTALADHLRRINPRIRLRLHTVKITRDNFKPIFSDADILIEAFDQADQKIMLIDTWSKSFPERYIICGNGLGGYGRTEELKVIRSGKIIFCGDMTSDMGLGLCAPRVAVVANMQANVAIEILMERMNKHDHGQ